MLGGLSGGCGGNTEPDGPAAGGVGGNGAAAGGADTGGADGAGATGGVDWPKLTWGASKLTWGASRMSVRSSGISSSAAGAKLNIPAYTLVGKVPAGCCRDITESLYACRANATLFSR